MKLRKSFIKLSASVPNILLLLSILTSNVFFPAIVIAEEIDQLPHTEVVEIVPLDESEDILEEGIAIGPVEEEVVEEEVLPTWVENGSSSTTNYVVVLGEVYTAPQNGAVSLSFTQLPEESGYLTINEITLTQEEIEATGSISSVAYDITTDMEDGTYEYDLTLPTTSDDVNVVYAESRGALITGGTEVSEDISVENGRVEIEGLDHFTTFVVVSPISQAKCDVVLAGTTPGSTCYPTIQQAINNAPDGSEIYVASGMYNEYLSINQKAISLIGSGSGSTTIKSQHSGAVITVNNSTTTTPMKIEGFTIDAEIANNGIFLQNSASNVTVEDNNIINFTDKGVLISNSNNNIVEGNTITGSTSGSHAGVYLDNQAGNNTIDSNTITLATTGSGNLYDIWFAGANSKDNIVKDNTINGGSRAFQQDGGVSGTTTFSGNDIGPSEWGVSINGGSAVITGNTITNSVRPIEFGGTHNITITDNVLDGTTYDFININSFTGTLNPIQHNAFLNMGTAKLHNRTGSNVDAAENYWGDLDPSDNINNSGGGSIDYSPWWGENYVEDNHNTAWTWYTNDSIQDAIDIVLDGDIINLSNDFTITQQININKPLTLAGNDYTIFSNFTKTTNSNNSTLGIYGNDITIKDLTVDGLSGTDLHGITTYKAINLLFDNVTLLNNPRSGLVVNGSIATVNNITTSSNGWHGINVDQGTNVTEPSRLTILGTSSHDELAQIYVDDTTKDVQVIPNNQYYYINDVKQTNDRVYLLDVTGPSAAFTTPKADDIVSGDFRVEGTASDIHGIGRITLRFYEKSNPGSLIKQYNALTNYNVSSEEWYYDVPKADLPDGEYLMRAIIADNVSGSNKTIITEKYITVDNTAPTATFITPKADDIVSGDFRVEGTASDPHGIGRITLRFFDKSGTWPPVKEYNALPNYDNSLKWYYDVPKTDLPDGEYSMRVIIADDVSGTNKKTIIEDFVTVDNTGPNATFITPKADDIVSGDFRVEGTASDIHGIGRITLRFFDKSGTWPPVKQYNALPNYDDSSEKWYYDVPKADLPDGEYSMRAIIADTVSGSNKTIITEKYITVDNTAPVTTFTPNLSDQIFGSTITISGESVDINATSGVNLYYRETGTFNWSPMPMSPSLINISESSTFNWTYDWTPSSDGVYDIKASAYDSLGNTENSPIMTNIIFDTTGPTVGNINLFYRSGISYITGPYVNGLSGFRGKAKITDDLSGLDINSCYFTTDGSNWSQGTFLPSLETCFFSVNPLLLDGEYLNINVKMSDNAGNSGVGTSLSKQADSKLPTVVIDDLNNFYGPQTFDTTGTIKGTASDTVSPITSVKIRIQRSDGKYWNNIPHTPINWSVYPIMFHSALGTDSWKYAGPYPIPTNGETYTIIPYAKDGVQRRHGTGSPDSFTWDSQAPQDPTVSSSSHEVNGYSKDNTIEVAFSGAHDYGLSGVAGYYYTFSNNQETPIDDQNNWLPLGTNSVTSESLADGTWWFNIRTIDNVGNITSTTHYGPLNIDTTLAVITWDTPDDDSLHNTPVLLSAHTDETMNNFRFKWQLEGEAWNSGYNNNSQDISYNYTFDPAVDGVYHLRAQGRDLAKNWSKASDDITITVDRIAPVVGITEPSHDDFVKGIVDISGFVTDTNLSHYNISIYPRGVDVHDFSLRLEGQTISGPQFSNTQIYSWDTTGYPDGEYQIRLAARDLAGNRELNGDSEHVITVTVDNTVPDRPSGLRRLLRSDHNVVFECGAYSPIQGMHPDWDDSTDLNFDYYEYSSFNAPNGSQGIDERRFEESIFEYNGSWTPDEGTYGFAVRAIDKAGNISEWALTDETLEGSCQITYDDTAPEIEDIIDTLDLEEGEDIPDVLAEITDETGLQKVHYELSNADLGTFSDTKDISSLSETINISDLVKEYALAYFGEDILTIDTFYIPEGIYTITYYAEDLAGNTSPEETLTITITNVSPIVDSFTSDIIAITEGETVNFQAIFSDPAYIEYLSGEEHADDAPWTYSFLPEGTTSFDNTTDMPGKTLTFAHTYSNEGTYFAQFKVCESDVDKGEGECSDKTIEITVEAPPEEAVAGAGDYRYYADGTGSGDALLADSYVPGDEVLGEEDEVQGLLDRINSCETTKKLFGYLYIDKDKDGEKDNNEKVLANVSLKIFIPYNGNEITVKEITTDENGYWETYLCPGDYNISVDQEDLPKNIDIEEVLSVTVSEDEDETQFNITGIDSRNFWQKYWYIILITLALGITTTYVILSNKKRE